MQQALESFSDEEKEIIQQKGIKVHESIELSPYINPHKNEYWLSNAFMFSVMLVGRNIAQYNRRPTLAYSSALCAIPFMALLTTSKLDKRRDYLQHTKTLEDRLEFHPITRTAFERAMEMNKKHQDDLKTDIKYLKVQLGLVK